MKASYSPKTLCRMDANLIHAIAEERHIRGIAGSACLSIIICTMIYGASFGIWRAPEQALYSMIKMPVLIFSVVAASIVVNAMLAQVIGSKLSFAQTSVCIFLSLAITSILLAALSPIALYFSTQVPCAKSARAMSSYRLLLILNTSLVGMCGLIGNIKLYQLLVALTGSASTAGRVLLNWICVSGLVGCELSWLFSPFLARPDLPIPFFNPNAFTSNFFEYLWII